MAIEPILVVGNAADNLGKQAGGWTIEWQGRDGNHFPGTSVLSALRLANSRGAPIIYDRDARRAFGASCLWQSRWSERHPMRNGLAIAPISTLAKKTRIC